MGSLAELSLWAWIVLEAGARSASLLEIADGRFADECVRAHNEARSSVSPPASDMMYMTWDEGLAVTARAWAKRCAFRHNPHLKDAGRMHPTFPSVGENVWTGHPPSAFDAERAIRLWVDEKEHYDYQANNCSRTCGHYTQVVWGSSYKVGCAAQLCPDGVANYATREGVVFVCNYATAGNTNRQRPYESRGAACSGRREPRQNNLCRSAARDSQKSYSWTPDWAATGSHYVHILYVRPVALFLTFATAYTVHHFYPDVFCYE